MSGLFLFCRLNISLQPAVGFQLFCFSASRLLHRNLFFAQFCQASDLRLIGLAPFTISFSACSSRPLSLIANLLDLIVCLGWPDSLPVRVSQRLQSSADVPVRVRLNFAEKTSPGGFSAILRQGSWKKGQMPSASFSLPSSSPARRPSSWPSCLRSFINGIHECPADEQQEPVAFRQRSGLFRLSAMDCSSASSSLRLCFDRFRLNREAFAQGS